MPDAVKRLTGGSPTSEAQPKMSQPHSYAPPRQLSYVRSSSGSSPDPSASIRRFSASSVRIAFGRPSAICEPSGDHTGSVPGWAGEARRRQLLGAATPGRRSTTAGARLDDDINRAF